MSCWIWIQVKVESIHIRINHKKIQPTITLAISSPAPLLNFTDYSLTTNLNSSLRVCSDCAEPPEANILKRISVEKGPATSIRHLPLNLPFATMFNARICLNDAWA